MEITATTIFPHKDWEAPENWAKIEIMETTVGISKPFFVWVTPEGDVLNRHKIRINPGHFPDTVAAALRAAPLVVR